MLQTVVVVFTVSYTSKVKINKSILNLYFSKCTQLHSTTTGTRRRREKESNNEEEKGRRDTDGEKRK